MADVIKRRLWMSDWETMFVKTVYDCLMGTRLFSSMPYHMRMLELSWKTHPQIYQMWYSWYLNDYIMVLNKEQMLLWLDAKFCREQGYQVILVWTLNRLELTGTSLHSHCIRTLCYVYIETNQNLWTNLVTQGLRLIHSMHYALTQHNYTTELLLSPGAWFDQLVNLCIEVS